MIAMVTATVLALTVGLILFMAYRSWRTNNEYARLRRDAAFAVQMVAKEIRKSSLSNITTNAAYLGFATNAVRPYTALFERGAGTNVYDRNLTYKRNGVLQGTLINKGCKNFFPTKIDDTTTNYIRDGFTNNLENSGLFGVSLRLVLVNSDSTITVTNDTFIYTRNE